MTSPLPRPSPRHFAPLRETIAEAMMGEGEQPALRLKGIVFDFDGTLCEPQTYMFAQMRSAIGIPAGQDILEHVYALPAALQAAALQQIQSIERAAMVKQAPQPGLLALMTYLGARAVPKAICTRNFDAPVAHLLDNFLNGFAFDPVITRAFHPPKPHPAGILHIAAAWGLDGAESLIMVGDSLDDMTAGHRAGAATVLLVNDVNAHLATHEHTDLCIRRLDELVAVLDGGFVGRTTAEKEGR